MLILEKAMENVEKIRDVKLITTQIRRNYFLSESNYHTPNTRIKLNINVWVSVWLCRTKL